MRWISLPMVFWCASLWAALELPHWATNPKGVCSFFIRARKSDFLEAAHLDLARRMGFMVPSDNLKRLKTDILHFLITTGNTVEAVSQGNVGPLIQALANGEKPHREDFLIRSLPQALLDFELVREVPEFRATPGLAPYYFSPGNRENELTVYWRVLKTEGTADLSTLAHEHFARVASPRPLSLAGISKVPGNEKDEFTVFKAQVSLSLLTNP